ncbi:MAG: hypothetical protein QGG24_06105, partial [Vicinamibacterales bacterium]|nr:hypothetical protein [Vicinamibacterales bacterium]
MQGRFGAAGRIVEGNLEVVPEVVERIVELRARGFATGLLTNNIAEAWPVVADGLALDELF